jgi:hypothetical protein
MRFQRKICRWYPDADAIQQQQPEEELEFRRIALEIRAIARRMAQKHYQYVFVHKRDIWEG